MYITNFTETNSAKFSAFLQFYVALHYFCNTSLIVPDTGICKCNFPTYLSNSGLKSDPTMGISDSEKFGVRWGNDAAGQSGQFYDGLQLPPLS